MQIKERMTADLLFSKAVLCTISVVKADCVQGGAATNHVQREISISVAALNGSLWQTDFFPFYWTVRLEK